MVFEIERFYRETDGDDWLPAVMRAQHEWNATPGMPNPSRGFTLQFAPRRYRFSGTVEIIRGMGLVGSGGTGWYAGTVLSFPAGVNGIVFHTSGTAPSATPGVSGWAIVERMRLFADAPTASAPPAHGILGHGAVTLRDVCITGFTGDGIRMVADVHSTPLTNANQWQIEHCRVELCQGNGLFLDGGDTNAGCATMFDCSDNDGWGIYDSSFLGNTFVACHTANNGYQMVIEVAPTDPALAGRIPDGWDMPDYLSTPLNQTNPLKIKNSFHVYLAPGVTLASYYFEYYPLQQPEQITISEVQELPDGRPEGDLLFIQETSHLQAGEIYIMHVHATDSAGATRDSALAFRIESKVGGPYKTDNSNQRSMFLNCYSERSQSPSEIVPPSLIMGGLHGSGFTGGAFSLIGGITGSDYISPHTTQVEVSTPEGPRSASMTVGTTDPGVGSYLSLSPPGGSVHKSYLKHVNTNNPNFPYQGDWYGFNWALLDESWSFMIPHNKYTSKIRMGINPADNMPVEKAVRMSPAFPQGGFYMMAGNLFNWFGYSGEGGPPSAGTWEENDILINRVANNGTVSSEWIGEICILGGTAGTYTGGRIATADGTNVVTLDGPPGTNFAIGDYIIINGVPNRITSISETQLTLYNDIPAGSSLPIAYRNPIWRRFGRLEP